jgi:hypothetical protein
VGGYHWHLCVWAALLSDRLNGHAYCVFLQEVLPVLFDDVPLVVRCDMWFQHNGTPAHFSAQTQQHLNTQFPDRWLGYGGPVSWPARLPDLNPLDFFLWGHLKEIDSRNLLTDMENLRAMLLWRPLMQTCYYVCKLVFHDMWLHVGECMVDTLKTCCNYLPVSYISAVFCVGKRCMHLRCCLS